MANFEMDYRQNLWLETLAECCHCYPDDVGNMPCDNGCICDKCNADWVKQVYHGKVEKAFNANVNKLGHELETIAAWMQRNDPNGEYTAMQLFNHPLEHIELLEQWKKDMGMESTERERIHFDDMISTLYVVLFAHKL